MTCQSVNRHETSFPMLSPSLHFTLCENCGYSFCGENYKNYLKLKKEKMSGPGDLPRVGDGVKSGRESHMTDGAVAILKRKKLRVLIFAPGNSLDHELVRQLDAVAECKITDLKNFQNSEHFIPIVARKVFDIVIVCEVVEHFTQPRKEFSNIFSLLDTGGIIVISVNPRQVGDFSRTLYPFLYGHTSYYSGKSLIFLARANDLFIDFRTPAGGAMKKYRNSKRYIYMTKSEEVHSKVIEYFSRVNDPVCE